MVNEKFRQKWNERVKGIQEDLEQELYLIDLSICAENECSDFPCGVSRYSREMKAYQDLVGKESSSDFADDVFYYLGGNRIGRDNLREYSKGITPPCIGNCFRRRNLTEEGFD